MSSGYNSSYLQSDLEKKRNIRLKLKNIIDELDQETLKAFILQYASNDRTFEIALKSHFISRIRTGLDESDKYKRILEEIIKPKNAHNKIGPSQKKIISFVLKDFVLQMNDCLSMDNYMEVYYLIKESLEKIAYLQNRYSIQDQNIETYRIQILGGLDIILDKELAPAFRNKIETELKELASKSYFIPKDENLLELLNAKNVLIHEEKSEFISDLVSKCKHREDYIALLKTIIQLSYPFPDLAKDILLIFDHDKIFKAINSLIKEGKFDYVDFYIDNPEVVFKYNKKLLNIFKYIEKEEHQNLNKCLIELADEELSILELRKLTEAIPDIYLRKELDKIIDWVNTLPFSLRSSIFAKANKNEKLLELIELQGDIEWLKVYDKLLIERNKRKEVKDLYLKISEEFLKDHIGSKSKEYLDRIQIHLLKIGEPAIFKEIYTILSEKFHHRISLNN